MTFTLTKLPTTKPEALGDESAQFTLTKLPEKPTVAQQTARGVGQGAVDVLGLGALPLYPIERGIQALFGTESEPGLSPQQEARFGAQFDTLNRLQEQPGYIPTMEELQALSDDDIGGGSGTSLGRLHQIQEEIPEGGIYQEGIRRVTRSLPFAASGALGGILGAEFTGLGAREAVGALGGGETAQTVADITGGLGYGLKSLFSKPTQSLPAVAEKQGGIMQAIEKQSPKAMEKRLLSLSNNVVKDFGKKISDITDKEISHLSEFSAREIEDAISKEARGTILNKITPHDQLPQQAWKGVQEGANRLFEAEQAVYSPLYRNVRQAAEKISVSPTKSISMARNTLSRLTNVRTSPSGYTQTANLVREVLHDLTGVSPNAEIIKTALETGNTKLLEAVYDSLGKSGTMKADKLMDLSIRLNDAINYEALTPSVKDLLKPLQRTVKDELREVLKNNDPKSLKALTDADQLYKKTAERFGKDAISSLRSTESPEKMADVFSQPSNFENLVKLFGENSAQVKDAERQIVERLGKINTEAAKDLFRQLEPYLSKNAQEAGKDVIALGDKLSVPGQRRALQQSMLEDVSQAVTTGQPPNFTTRAMMTPQGYQTAKATFARSTGGKELFKTLEKKLVSDLLDSVVTEGQINWQKAAQILDNPNVATVMQEIIGFDGVAMLKSLQNYSRNIAGNLGLKKVQQPTLFNNIINKMDNPTKLLLGAFVGKALAAPLWLLVGAPGTVAVKRSIAALLTDPKARTAFRSISDLKATGTVLLNDIGILNKVLQDELE